ncbi:MAG: GTP cyclohydrolase II [Alphaproteobacteria bacterium]
MSDWNWQHKAGIGEPPGRAGGVAVERAIGDLRRGGVVLLGDSRGVLLVQAAEAAISPGAFIALTGEPASCIVPAGRALALGLETGGGGNMALRRTSRDGEEMQAALVRTIAGVDTAATGLPSLSVTPAQGLQNTAVELVKLARLLPVALVAGVAGDPLALARAHNLLSVEAAAVADYRSVVEEGGVTPVARAPVPLEGAGDAEIIAFRPADGGKEHLAIVIGQPDPAKPVLTRIHSECFTGDLLGSLRCDCGEQLRGAIRAISRDGGGILLYLAQEGRGIGLVSKLHAYRLQDEGFDTIDANERLGFDADERVYRPAAIILRQLGYKAVRLLTNNPAKVAGLTACGISIVDRVPHAFPANGHNEAYLKTKAARAGHLL